MIAFNLKWAIPDRCCAILFCMLKKKQKDLLFALLGKVNAFYKYKMAICLGISQQPPIFKKQALRHRMSHSMTDSHKSTLYRAKAMCTYRARALGSHYIQDEVSVICPTYAGI